jgi:hypothetical protein
MHVKIKMNHQKDLIWTRKGKYIFYIQDGGLSDGAVAGIVVGVVAGVALVAVAAFLFVRWRYIITQTVDSSLIT